MPPSSFVPVAYGIDDVTLGFEMEGSGSIERLNALPGSQTRRGKMLGEIVSWGKWSHLLGRSVAFWKTDTARLYVQAKLAELQKQGDRVKKVATTSSISVITVERSGFFMSFAPPPLCARVSHRLIASSGAEVERAAPAGGCVGRGVHKLSRVPNPLDLQGRSNKCTPHALSC